MHYRFSVFAIAVAIACRSSLACEARRGCPDRAWTAGVVATQTLGGTTMAYRYYLPENYDPNINYPLALFLHGSGERGNDNITQVSRHIAGLIDKTYSDYPAILVAPQAPFSTSWSTSTTRELTEDVVERIMTEFSVDANRLYLTGLSMGGFGTIDYLDYYTNSKPDVFKFAAAVPMSSGIGGVVDLSQNEPWQDTPIWLIHGDRDTVVSVDLSRNAFRSYSGIGEDAPLDFSATVFGQPTAIADNVRYTEYVGGGHVIWSPVYNSNEMYDWMFAQSLAVPEPSSIVLAALAFAGAFARQRKRGSLAEGGDRDRWGHPS